MSSGKCYLNQSGNRQGCMYTANGELACNVQGDGVNLILAEKPTFQTNMVDRRNKAEGPVVETFVGMDMFQKLMKKYSS